MTASPVSASSSDVERVRLLYRETNVPAEVLAACLGLARPTFYRRIAEWEWPRRRVGWSVTRSSEHDAGASSQSASAGKPSIAGLRSPVAPRESTAQAMDRFIAERLAALRAASASGLDADPERTARTVAQYARALQVLQATRAQSDKEPTPDEAEPPARSLSELRDELRGHLERIWDETRARRRARTAEPDAS